MEANPITGLRHGIIRSNIPTDRALELMAGGNPNYGLCECEARGER